MTSLLFWGTLMLIALVVAIAGNIIGNIIFFKWVFKEAELESYENAQTVSKAPFDADSLYLDHEGKFFTNSPVETERE